MIREAMEQCAEDGVEPSRNAILERIGKFRGKPVSDSQLKSWTGNASKWSPFRIKAGTNLIYDKDNQALEFDGEIDLSE